MIILSEIVTSIEYNALRKRNLWIASFKCGGYLRNSAEWDCFERKTLLWHQEAQDSHMYSRGPWVSLNKMEMESTYSLREPLNDNGWLSFVFQTSINIPWMSLLKIGPTKAMKSCIRLFIVYQKFTIHTQQHRQYLGTSQKCRVPGSTSDLLNYIYMCVDDTYAH